MSAAAVQRFYRGGAPPAAPPAEAYRGGAPPRRTRALPAAAAAGGGDDAATRRYLEQRRLLAASGPCSAAPPASPAEARAAPLVVGEPQPPRRAAAAATGGGVALGAARVRSAPRSERTRPESSPRSLTPRRRGTLHHPLLQCSVTVQKPPGVMLGVVWEGNSTVLKSVREDGPLGLAGGSRFTGQQVVRVNGQTVSTATDMGHIVRPAAKVRLEFEDPQRVEVRGPPPLPLPPPPPRPRPWTPPPPPQCVACLDQRAEGVAGWLSCRGAVPHWLCPGCAGAHMDADRGEGCLRCPQHSKSPYTSGCTAEPFEDKELVRVAPEAFVRLAQRRLDHTRARADELLVGELSAVYLAGVLGAKGKAEKRLEVYCPNGTEIAEWKAENTRPCPGCDAPIEKDGGCPMMFCTRCNRSFNWKTVRPWGQEQDGKRRECEFCHVM